MLVVITGESAKTVNISQGNTLDSMAALIQVHII